MSPVSEELLALREEAGSLRRRLAEVEARISTLEALEVQSSQQSASSSLSSSSAASAEPVKDVAWSLATPPSSDARPPLVLEQITPIASPGPGAAALAMAGGNLEKAWALKRDWTDMDFQQGEKGNAAQLQEFEDCLVDRLQQSWCRAMGADSLPEQLEGTSVKVERQQKCIDDSRGVLACALVPLETRISKQCARSPAELKAAVLSDPEVLGSSLDIVGAYLKNYEVDKAAQIIATILPACRERGGLWEVKVLNFYATVLMKQARPQEALAVLKDLEASIDNRCRLEETNESWEFWETMYRNFSWALSALDRNDEAILYSQKAIDAKERVGKPASWFDFWDLGRLKASKALDSRSAEGIAESQALVTKALWAHKDAEPSDYVMRAKIWHSVGECSFGLGFLEQGGPSSETAAGNGAVSCSRAKAHYKKALKCFKESHKLFHKTEGQYNALTGQEAQSVAWTLMKLDDVQEAKSFLLDSLEAMARQQNGWGDGSEKAPALLAAVQILDRILEAHRRSDDRDGLRRYFDAVEKLCTNVCSRLRLAKDQSVHASAYERMVSSASMVMVASGTSEGQERSQQLLQRYLWHNPSTTQAQVCSQMMTSLQNGESGGCFGGGNAGMEALMAQIAKVQQM